MPVFLVIVLGSGPVTLKTNFPNFEDALYHSNFRPLPLCCQDVFVKHDTRLLPDTLRRVLGRALQTSWRLSDSDRRSTPFCRTNCRAELRRWGKWLFFRIKTTFLTRFLSTPQTGLASVKTSSCCSQPFTHVGWF